MSPEVTAAVIAASISFLTLIGTLAAQYFGRRATRARDTKRGIWKSSVSSWTERSRSSALEP